MTLPAILEKTSPDVKKDGHVAGVPNAENTETAKVATVVVEESNVLATS